MKYLMKNPRCAALIKKPIIKEMYSVSIDMDKAAIKAKMMFVARDFLWFTIPKKIFAAIRKNRAIIKNNEMFVISPVINPIKNKEAIEIFAIKCHKRVCFVFSILSVGSEQIVGNSLFNLVFDVFGQLQFLTRKLLLLL